MPRWSVFVMFLASYQLRECNSTLMHLVLPKEQSSNFRVFRTDGVETTVTKLPQACGTGRGVVYFRSPDGKCYNSRNFNTKFGTVNQLSSEDDRTHYSGSKVTLIDHTMIDAAGSPLAYYKAASRGQAGAASNVQVVAGSITRTYLDHKMTVFEVTAQTTLKVSTGILCSFTTGECGTVLQSGSAESYYYGDGAGIKAFSVGGTRPETDIIPNEKNKYLPSNTTSVSGQPMGTDYMTWVSAGAPSEIFEEQFLRLYPEYAAAVEVCTTAPCKRFAGLALATYNVYYLKTLKDAFRTALSLADLKQEELQNFFTLQGKTIEQLGELGVQNTGLLVEAQARSYELGAAESYLDNVFLALRTGVDDAEDLALFMATYLVNHEVHESDSFEAATTEIKTQYPDWTIVTKTMGPSAYFFTLSQGSIVTPSSAAECGDTQCYLQGKWWLWRTENDVIELDTPIVNTQSCGVFFQSRGEADRQIMAAKTDFQRALDYAKTLTGYAYINDRACTHEVNMQNTILGELNSYLEENNMNKIALYGDEYFILNCTAQIESNVTELIGRERAYCDKMSKIDSIRLLQSRINNVSLTRATSVGEFDKIVNSATRFDRVLGGMSDAALDNVRQVGEFGKSITNAAKKGTFTKMEDQFIGIYCWCIALTIMCGLLLFLGCRRTPSATSDPG